MTKKERILTKEQEKAAALIVDGSLGIGEIAKRIGVSDDTLENWRKITEFRDLMKRISEETERGLIATGIARRSARIGQQNFRSRLLEQVRAERAVEGVRVNAERAEKGDPPVPGIETGVIVKTVRSIGDGKFISVYEIDTGWFKANADLEKLVAIEMGQWVEKVAPTDPSGKNEFSGRLTDAERVAAMAALLNVARTRAVRAAAEGKGGVGTAPEAGGSSTE